jgi:glycosyltransferase involved in cell wall biosynthesis
LFQQVNRAEFGFMENLPSVDVAMPTYNAASWLDACLNSILGQAVPGMRIVARDDLSEDGTVNSLRAWQARWPRQLKVVEDGRGNLGMNGNYSAVLSETSAPLVMLTDPDDVWLPDKVRISIDAMRKAQEQFGEGTPMLVCTDAKVVDNDLQIISESYRRWVRNEPGDLNTFKKIITECAALTSTILVNRALLERALPIPKKACPDWWLALVACAFGSVVYLPDPTVLYRRHPGNDSLAPIGGNGFRTMRFAREAKATVEFLIRQSSGQARAFHDRYGKEMPEPEAEALRAAATLEFNGWLTRRRKILQHRLWFASPLKNIGLMLLA